MRSCGVRRGQSGPEEKTSDGFSLFDRMKETLAPIELSVHVLQRRSRPGLVSGLQADENGGGESMGEGIEEHGV